MSMGTPTRSPPQNLTMSTYADDHIPDTPESLTDVLERIEARSEAAGHKVTIDLPLRPSLALADNDNDNADGAAGGAEIEADQGGTHTDESYDVDSARKLLVQAQRRTDRILTDQRQRRMLLGGGMTTLDADERQQLQQAQQSGGIISSAGNWLFGSKIERRRKEGLRVQVEEQRRVLRRAIKRQSSNNSADGDGNHKHHHHHHSHHNRSTAAAGGMFAGGICSAISAAYSYEQSDDDEASTSSGQCSRCSSATSVSRQEENDDDDDDVVEHPIDTGSGYHVNVHVPTPKAAKAKESQEASGNGDGFDFDAAAAAAETNDADQTNNSNDDGYANVDDDDDLAMEVVVEAEDNTTKHILNAAQMKSVALNVLPPSVRYCRWRRLYSLARDGDSFEAFLRHVAGWKRTLLVLSTSRGDVFGAYADSAWENQGHSLGATFYGSAQASLWRIQSKNDNNKGGSNSSPGSRVIVYKWTGANRYIQLCDPQAKLLALGGGGDDGEFGLCVENDFQRGSTGSCETFGNEPLCSQDRFDIVDLECYGFPAGFA